MTVRTDWKALAEKYADPLAAIDLADFAEATADDVFKFRTDLHGGKFYAPSDGSVTRAEGDEDSGTKGREFDFVMSTEKPVGPFGDVLLVKGWQLQDFRKRGQPFLFAHNLDDQLPPLGKMDQVKKDLVGTPKTGPFLGGRAQLTPPGLNPFNDLISDSIDSGFMPGGSVGFRMVNPRGPTDEELEADKKLGKFSFISDKTTLIEFSSVPVGMDPDAVTKRAAALGSLEALLVRWIEEGRYEDDVVAEFRRLMGAPTSTATPVYSFGRGDGLVPEIKVATGEGTRTFEHLSNEDVEQIDADGVDAEMVETILDANHSLMEAQTSLMESQSALVDSLGELRVEVDGLRSDLESTRSELQEARAFVESLFGDGDEGEGSTATNTDDRSIYAVIADMPEEELRAFLKTG